MRRRLGLRFRANGMERAGRAYSSKSRSPDASAGAVPTRQTPTSPVLPFRDLLARALQLERSWTSLGGSRETLTIPMPDADLFETSATAASSPQLTAPATHATFSFSDAPAELLQQQQGSQVTSSGSTTRMPLSAAKGAWMARQGTGMTEPFHAEIAGATMWWDALRTVREMFAARVRPDQNTFDLVTQKIAENRLELLPDDVCEQRARAEGSSDVTTVDLQSEEYRAFVRAISPNRIFRRRVVHDDGPRLVLPIIAAHERSGIAPRVTTLSNLMELNISWELALSLLVYSAEDLRQVPLVPMYTRAMETIRLSQELGESAPQAQTWRQAIACYHHMRGTFGLAADAESIDALAGAVAAFFHPLASTKFPLFPTGGALWDAALRGVCREVSLHSAANPHFLKGEAGARTIESCVSLACRAGRWETCIAFLSKCDLTATPGPRMLVPTADTLVLAIAACFAASKTRLALLLAEFLRRTYTWRDASQPAIDVLLCTGTKSVAAVSMLMDVSRALLTAPSPSATSSTLSQNEPAPLLRPDTSERIAWFLSSCAVRSNSFHVPLGLQSPEKRREVARLALQAFRAFEQMTLRPGATRYRAFTAALSLSVASVLQMRQQLRQSPEFAEDVERQRALQESHYFVVHAAAREGNWRLATVAFVSSGALAEASGSPDAPREGEAAAATAATAEEPRLQLLTETRRDQMLTATLAACWHPVRGRWETAFDLVRRAPLAMVSESARNVLLEGLVRQRRYACWKEALVCYALAPPLRGTAVAEEGSADATAAAGTTARPRGGGDPDVTPRHRDRAAAFHRYLRRAGMPPVAVDWVLANHPAMRTHFAADVAARAAGGAAANHGGHAGSVEEPESSFTADSANHW